MIDRANHHFVELSRLTRKLPLEVAFSVFSADTLMAIC